MTRTRPSTLAATALIVTVLSVLVIFNLSHLIPFSNDNAIFGKNSVKQNNYDQAGGTANKSDDKPILKISIPDPSCGYKVNIFKFNKNNALLLQQKYIHYIWE